MADLYDILENYDVDSCVQYLNDQLNSSFELINYIEQKHKSSKYDFMPLNFITKVIQQDKYTIIIDDLGRKYVVKARGEKFDKEKGLMACLLKYLATPKGYSNLMNIYPDNPKLEKVAFKGALIAHIGPKDLSTFLKEHGD